MEIIQKPVTNFNKGRKGRMPLAVVVHIGEGTADIIYQTFLTEDKSSHYLVLRDGTVWQFVDEKNTAWGNGIVVRPKALLCKVFNGLNPNLYTISIENEGMSTEDITPAQYASNIELIKEICLRNGITPNRNTILKHSEIREDKTCPGKIDVDKICKAVQQACGYFTY